MTKCVKTVKNAYLIKIVEEMAFFYGSLGYIRYEAGYMQSKLSGVRSWLLVGLTASLVAVPLYATSNSMALSKEELRTAFASTTAAPNRQRTVKIGPRDTLWSIARSNRPNNSVTIKQAMLAIRDANPKAFPSSNINEMEIGNPLIIPSTQAMTRRSAMQAEQEVRQQNQAWVASRAAPSKPVAKTPAPKAQTPVAAAAKPDIKKAPLDLPDSKPVQRDLTLVAPNANQAATQIDEANKAQQQRINQLQNDLASSEESLQVAEREKDELAERISNMQQQVSTLQQLIQLKDQQLTDMERQLALEQTAAPVVNRGLAPTSLAPTISANTQPPESNDLASQIKRQPLLYGALAGSTLLLLALLAALISARKKLKAVNNKAANDKPSQSSAEPLTSAFAEEQARSDDFDIDLNNQPLANATGFDKDDLPDFNDAFNDDLSDDLSDDDFGDDLLNADFNLDNLEDELSTFSEAPEAKQPPQAVVRDALQEAEMFIAYGRLEQAAGFLQAALAKEPSREDLRVKLLEVLVELNDEETFRQEQQKLEEYQASNAALARVKELASFFVVANPAATDLEAGTDEDDLGDLDLGEIDLGEMNLDELDLDNDLSDLDSIFPDESDTHTSFEEMQEPIINLDDFNAEFDLDNSIDDLADIDPLEAELDDLIASKAPLAPSLEDSEEETEFDLEELSAADLVDLELELDLEKPLDAAELNDQGDASADFEPVDYKSDADDFMQALDSLSLDDEQESVVTSAPKATYQAQGIDEELAALNENIAELKAFSENSTSSSAADDLSDLNDLSDLDDLSELDSFSGLDDLGDLGDLGDLELDSADGDMATQLDLATAYIEMGDKEGAKEILEKVAQEGDADSRATAQQMLETLA